MSKDLLWGVDFRDLNGPELMVIVFAGIWC